MSWTDVLAAACLLIGSGLALCAGIGLVRFPDVLARMHAATKPQTLGLLLVLVGIGLRAEDKSVLSLLLLVAIFQLMTTPVSAHMLARAAFRAGKVDRRSLTRDEIEQ